jgi:hypothetical protein
MIRPLRRVHARIAQGLWWLLPLIAFAAYSRWRQ